MVGAVRVPEHVTVVPLPAVGEQVEGSGAAIGLLRFTCQRGALFWVVGAVVGGGISGLSLTLTMKDGSYQLPIPSSGQPVLYQAADDILSVTVVQPAAARVLLWRAIAVPFRSLSGADCREGA